MPQHVSIGAVFVLAWRSLRQRFLPIILLSLLQALWVPLLILWQHLPDAWSASAVWQDSLLLASLAPFLIASMAIVLEASPPREAGPGKATLLLRRFLPTLVAVAISGALIAAVAVLAFAGLRYVALYARVYMWSIASFFVGLVILAIGAVPLFVVLPAALLENGGPLRAIGRSLVLTRHQHWRIGAMVLMLAALLLGLTLILFWVSFSYGFAQLPDERGGMLIVEIGSCLLWWFYPLISTLLVASTYQLAVPLRDGIPLSSLQRVFE